MKHPAENYLKYLLIKDPTLTDLQLEKALIDALMLKMPQGEESYYGFLRSRLPKPPSNFDPTNRAHRASMQYLREQGVYDLFFPNEAANEAWGILTDLEKRMFVEQLIFSRVPIKAAVMAANKKQAGWRLTSDGVETYGHYFWNVKLLSFDEWGRFLYARSSMYEKYMGLLHATPDLAFYHLRLDQTLETKDMIRKAAEICHFTLLELSQKPGTSSDKVKGIQGLTKAIVECHQALSTSDVALKDVLKQFEKFRVKPNEIPMPSIHQLAPAGNYSGSGADGNKKGE